MKIMKNEHPTVYWLPTDYHESRFNPSRADFEKLTVIKTVNNRRLERDLYFDLLAGRILYLLTNERSPMLAAGEAVDRMGEYGLHKPERDEDAAFCLISGNWKLREYLQDIGLTIPRGKIFVSAEESARAELVYSSIKSIEEWTAVLSSGRAAMTL